MNETAQTVTYDARVAANAKGGFVVVWDSGTGPNPSQRPPFARRFAADGTPRGGEFSVDPDADGPGGLPDVAVHDSGGFVIVWQRFGAYGDWIVGRRFGATGEPLGESFRVDTGVGYVPAVASAGGDAFVVAWSGYPSATQSHPINPMARRFDASGTPLDAPFRVSASYLGVPSSVRIAADRTTGRFVVVWLDWIGGPDEELWLRGFDGSGAPLFAERRVDAVNPQLWGAGGVCLDANGRFVVSWSDSGVPLAQRFGADGVPRSEPGRLDQDPLGTGTPPRIACDSTGGFVAAWQSGTGGWTRSHLAQRVADTGELAGARVTVTEPYVQQIGHNPDIASDAVGNFVVVWRDDASHDVLARVYQVVVAGDVNGDGKADVSDVLALINHLFAGGAPPAWNAAADANGDGAVDVADVLFLINWLFAGGPAPPARPLPLQ